MSKLKQGSKSKAPVTPALETATASQGLARRPSARVTPPAIRNVAAEAARMGDEREAFQNGLSEALGFGGNLNFEGFAQGGQNPWSEQLSKPTTMFKNLRWYLVSNFRQFLSELYVEIGLVQTIVDVPVEDALRGGVKISTKQLDEDDIAKLQASLERDNDITNVAQALKWCRLFGGAGVLILTDQDPEEPLDMDAIDENTPLEFRPVDMWELFWDKQNAEGYDPTIQQHDVEFYSYYGEKVHASRVLKMKGLTAPSFIRPRLRGWGFSVVEKLVRSINQYMKATDLSFEVLDEFKLDVYKIKGLTNSLLNPGAEAAIKKRIQLGNWQKNYQNALSMDAEDDFDHKQLSFSGLAETMQGIRTQVAADMRMPITKLFGISATGFNSGEDDIEVYNSMVESEVRTKAKYDILRVVELKCQKLFGFVPDDLMVEFKPLRVLSSTDEETVKTQKFNRVQQAFDAGHITEREYRDACNRDNLLGIKLETSDEDFEELEDQQADIEAEAEGDEENGDKTSDKDEPEKPKAKSLSNKSERPSDSDNVRKIGPGGIEPFEKRLNRRRQKTLFKEVKPFMPNLKAMNDNSSDPPEPRLVVLPKPFDPKELKRRLGNSAAFDRASYESDGGDNWIDPGRRPFFENPIGVDPAAWQRAEQASRDTFGEVRWQFVAWIYRKLGGRFNVSA